MDTGRRSTETDFPPPGKESFIGVQSKRLGALALFLSASAVVMKRTAVAPIRIACV
jgi:hypothetical protein